jgi:putative addiction module component (TIGR02574 family)
MISMQYSWDELRKLSRAERIQLAQDVWDSILQDGYDPLLSESQRNELERRFATLDEDCANTRPWDEIKRELGL